MRDARIKEEGDAYYHIISRVVDRRMIFNNEEKERFCRIMRAAEGFSGVQVLTHAVLSNHFHIVLYVPEREEVSDTLLSLRLRNLYGHRRAEALAAELADLRRAGLDELAETFKEKYTYRMYDISEFTKTLKQRLTMSYNSRHDRRGTLWEERFKSVLIEGNEGALSTVAAYVDLNAVRAGLAKDPKDYRFCGYGEAVGGSGRAQAGLSHAMGTLGEPAKWAEVARSYRKLLYTRGEARGVSETGEPARPGFSAQTVKAVLDAGGALPLNELLRCRVRYFTDGAVLGSRTFVGDVFDRHRHRFSPKRRTGPRGMLGGQWGGLCTARRLRLEVITPPIAS
jgi:putative transposase